MKRLVCITGGIVLGCVLLILMLRAITGPPPRHQHASFTRTFASVHLTPVDTVVLGRSYYLAGRTHTRLYFGSSQTPARLIEYAGTTSDTVHHTLRVADDVYYSSLQVAVDSPYFYLADGTVPFIYRGHLRTDSANVFRNDFYFSKVVPFGVTSLAVVALSQNENTLEKITGARKPVLYRDILEEQGEGIFSTDGMLVTDYPVQHLVYVYFYRNEFVVLDTAFQVLQRGHTIDSISKAQLVVKVTRNNSHTLGAPPLIVNKGVRIADGLLYVHANLLSRGEAVADFERHAVLDVYALHSGDYQHSFYVPQFKGHGLKAFVIVQGDFYGLYDGYLVRYRMTTNDITRA